MNKRRKTEKIIYTAVPVILPPIPFDVDSLDIAIEKYNKNATGCHRGIGVLGQPKDKVVQLDKVSHIAKRLYWLDGCLRAKLRILDTPSGCLLKACLDSYEGDGGFHLAAVGKVHSDGRFVFDEILQVYYSMTLPK